MNQNSKAGQAKPSPYAAQAERIARAALRMDPSDLRKYSVLRGLSRIESGKNLDGIEREVNAEMERALGRSARPGAMLVPTSMRFQRDLTTASGSSGGYLVGTQALAGEFVDMLRSKLVIAQLGARMLHGLQGNVTIPKQTATATAYWLANEATAITESQQTFGQIGISPKNVGAYTEVSRQLMLQSTPDAERVVMDDLAKVVALAIDAAAINGSGAAGQPQGIIGTSGVGSFTGTSLNYAGLIEAQTDLAAGNALDGSPGYLTTPSVAGVLCQRQRFTGTDSPLWGGNLSAGQIGGFKAMTTTAMPAGTMIFGNWSDVILADWGVIELATDPYTNFKTGVVGIRAWATVDIAIRNGASFTVATSIT